MKTYKWTEQQKKALRGSIRKWVEIDNGSGIDEKDELPYMVYTSRGYLVTGPYEDGEIDVETRLGRGSQDFSLTVSLFLTAADLRMMLDRIEREKK